MSLLLLVLGIWVGSGWVVLCFEHSSRLAGEAGVWGLITVSILSVFPVVRVLMREAVGESRLPFILILTVVGFKIKPCPVTYPSSI